MDKKCNDGCIRNASFTICFVGNCDCNNGWIREDCSVNYYTPPDVTGFPSVLCNRDSCKTVTVYGDNFVEGADLMCHLQTLSVSASELNIHKSFWETFSGHLIVFASNIKKKLQSYFSYV